MRHLLLLLVLFCGPTWAGVAIAVQPDEMLADASLEARARTISAELRCLVCQNQSIDDSDAPLARDLRVLVRQRLQAGDTDQGVRDYLVARYGDFILLKPPFSPSTWLLWLTPALVLVVGTVTALWAQRRGGSALGALSPEEDEQLSRILAEAGAQPSNLSKN